jgi:hypothetical protein
MSRINFLFALIMGLTACTPNTVPTPSLVATPSPVVTSSPTASIPPTSTATEIPSIPNPIDPENMDVLTRAGYLWDEQAGSLKNKDGNTILSFEDGKWVDEKGVESSKESLKINLTNGVYFDGKPIVAMLTRIVEINGEMETQEYGPLSEEWFKPANIPAGQELMDRNSVNNELGEMNWGDYKYITLDEIPEVSTEFAYSYKLWESRQLYLRPWPENVIQSAPLCVKNNVRDGNFWRMTQMPYGVPAHYAGKRLAGSDRPVVRENNGINQSSSVVKFRDRDGMWVVSQGIQYWQPGDNSVVLDVWHTKERADPDVLYEKSGRSEFDVVQAASVDYPFLMLFPNCSIEEARPFLPEALQEKMAETDNDVLIPAQEAGFFPMEAGTMAALQQIVFEGREAYTIERNELFNALRDEDHPLLHLNY